MSSAALHMAEAKRHFKGLADALGAAEFLGYRAVEAYCAAAERRTSAEIHAVFALMFLLEWDGES